MRETNTLVLSGLSYSQLDSDEYIRSIQQKIIKHVSHTNITQFIILRSLRRIVLIFEKRESAARLYDVFKQENTEFKTGYSLTDHSEDVKHTYLQLPSNGRMFLISPPASPPTGFDYNQEEEEPNKLQIYTHQELRESLLKHNNEIQELLKKSTDNKHDEDQWEELEEKEIVLNDSNKGDHIPKIVLHPIKGQNDHLISHVIQSFRTSLPAKSIFDDLSDNEYDSAEE